MRPKAGLRDSAKKNETDTRREERKIVNPLLITNQENLCKCLIKQTSVALELKASLTFYAYLITSYESSQELMYIIDSISFLGIMTGNV